MLLQKLGVYLRSNFNISFKYKVFRTKENMSEACLMSFVFYPLGWHNWHMLKKPQPYAFKNHIIKIYKYFSENEAIEHKTASENARGKINMAQYFWFLLVADSCRFVQCQ